MVVDWCDRYIASQIILQPLEAYVIDPYLNNLSLSGHCLPQLY